MTNNFSGYILAGGKSSRMGADKGFLEIGGKTFIENAIDALEPNCVQVKIVLNRSQTHFIEKLPERAAHIFDRLENRGALGGIHAALKDCETEFAVILAVDLPFVSSEMIKNLTKIVMSENFAAIVPRQTDGRWQPLCAVYRAGNCLPIIEKLLSEENSVSMRDFLRFIPVRFVETSELTNNNQDLFFNVNRPFDYERLSARR